MTVQADPTLPKDPATYRRRRPVLRVSLLAVFGLVCLLTGAALALFGPRLMPLRPQVPAPQPATGTRAAPSPMPAPDISAPHQEIARLQAKIAALESQEARTSEAAAAALAAAALLEATQTSRPFTGELSAVLAAAPELPELRALAGLAQTGAPSRAALASSFPEHAARAASAARAPGEDAGLRDRFVYAVSRIISVRRVANLTGGDADAVLARAERALADGDVARALRELDALPPQAREALAGWRAQAERRAEIDRRAAALRQRALRELAPSEIQG